MSVYRPRSQLYKRCVLLAQVLQLVQISRVFNLLTTKGRQHLPTRTPPKPKWTTVASASHAVAASSRDRKGPQEHVISVLKAQLAGKQAGCNQLYCQSAVNAALHNSRNLSKQPVGCSASITGEKYKLVIFYVSLWHMLAASREVELLFGAMCFFFTLDWKIVRVCLHWYWPVAVLS